MSATTVARMEARRGRIMMAQAERPWQETTLVECGPRPARGEDPEEWAARVADEARERLEEGAHRRDGALCPCCRQPVAPGGWVPWPPDDRQEEPVSRPDDKGARAWAGWLPPASYPALLSRAQAREVTRCDQAGALDATTRADPRSTLLTRVAYIQRESGGRAARAAERAADHAAAAAGTGHRDHARGQAVQTRFLDSWSAARDRWEAEHAAVLAADRLPGPVLRALRTTMGLDQASLAHHLAVSTDTVRWWESGRSLINHGATQEVWDMWQEWVRATRALTETHQQGDVPVLPPTPPSHPARRRRPPGRTPVHHQPRTTHHPTTPHTRPEVVHPVGDQRRSPAPHGTTSAEEAAQDRLAFARAALTTPWSRG
ncbi:hypothetical protein D5R93_02255 [Actinomyces lilanjuaniae]|uniref:HTH cro/C1-type domain-containing protein n=1 Tax=Actinomyces lilanjuaniae TaxID=2321394 RepID=A0ABN5PLF7_9ACTO|nr:helix-turn-helix domain-containing protein [Actinomyces lilanjuaniae]AYD89170.1 hypothetical protein D5R93_02255 [Actinomyces lilanjuaniae]